MDKRLHLLESFPARGNDGRVYTIHGYEHLVRVAPMPSEPDAWESTGVSEYKLSDGRHLEPLGDGRFVVAGSALRLDRTPVH